MYKINNRYKINIGYYKNIFISCWLAKFISNQFIPSNNGQRKGKNMMFKLIF